jgi:hypothetical protein
MTVADIAILFSILTPLVGFAGALLGALLGAHITAKAQLKISEKEREDRLKLAALDKRLEVHQKAYTLWHDILWATGLPETRGETIEKCQEWWLENCLYLDKKSMEQFQKGYRLLSDLQMGDREAVQEILKAGKYIAEGVYLPFLYDEKAE